MADVQPEKGYIRIATELMNEIIRRDFSKRQLAILHFIIRLSYGCHRKDCIVKRFNFFELAGLNKSDVKKELKFLRECRVVNWDENTMTFSLNKDYEKWQINPSKGFEKEKFDQLIHENLKQKVGEIPTKSSEKVSKTPTDLESLVGKTLTNLGIKVGKTLTTKLVKHQLELHGNDWESKDEEVLKDSIKDIYLKIKDHDDKDDKMQQNYFTEYEKAFGYPPALLISDFEHWIDSEESQFTEPEEIIIEVVHRAKKQIPRNPAKYVSGILKRLHDMELYSLDAVKAYNKKFDEKMSGGAKDGAKVHQYRSGYGRSTEKSNDDSITGGQVGWIGKQKSI
ncbi:phage replication O-like protein O [Bacillus pakistanensis]|uniref:Phage replication O-like protein O n=1 Tax=Rossellomorea pakistanensis TaxID=992288 RepID=A0ABS2ND88_9BACI|nr:replication protein [Bacillus pakistanensis]MBM7585815.1 phage replication O-like protein O [Bacillus pakistanensis]